MEVISHNWAMLSFFADSLRVFLKLQENCHNRASVLFTVFIKATIGFRCFVAYNLVLCAAAMLA